MSPHPVVMTNDAAYWSALRLLQTPVAGEVPVPFNCGGRAGGTFVLLEGPVTLNSNVVMSFSSLHCRHYRQKTIFIIPTVYLGGGHMAPHHRTAPDL